MITFESWLFRILLVLVILQFLLLTVVSCFWSVYLLDAIKRKWKVYKSALKWIQPEDNDSVQQVLAYDSRTEFVKFVFLFFMNLVEWLAFLFGVIGFILRNAKQFRPHKFTFHSNVSPLNVSSNNSEIYSNIPFEQNLRYIPNMFVVLTLILIASLCMYLSERFAKKSWIKSKYVPLMVFFLCWEIGIQILAFFCAIEIIALWCDKLFLIITFIIAIKQYWKLSNIINWSIVDLKNSRNYPLLKRQINSKRMFNRMFEFIWTGILLLIISELLGIILQTLTIVLREDNTFSFHYLFLCEESHLDNLKINQIFSIIHYSSLVIGLIGVSFFFIPYTVYGLSTMCVMLWRLIRGKTGYRTHFHNDLHAPLI